MKIKIDQKISPFSKVAGTEAMIPKTTFSAKIFPVKIEFYNREKSKGSCDLALFLKIKGPINHFEVFQNIERSFIEVKGFSEDGFIRYQIKEDNGSISIFFEKLPTETIEVILGEGNKSQIIGRKTLLSLPLKTKVREESDLEKLSFGIHKAQDIELVNRRSDLLEIFPIWFALAQRVFETKPSLEGNALLFSEAERFILEDKKIELEKLFKNIYQVGFSSLFVPSLVDEKHQGIVDENSHVSKSSSPLVMFQKGFELIRSLFISQKDSDISILPCLLPIFHSGRMVNINLKSIGFIDIEWSKKLLKKMIIYSKKSMKIRFKLQKPIKSFRMRSNLKDMGKIINASSEIYIEKDQIYFFDKFQK